jgi:hypothetical protein
MASRREALVNFPVQPLAMILLDLREVEQELALGFREDFHCSPQVPNDHGVLLSRLLVICHQFSEILEFLQRRSSRASILPCAPYWKVGCRRHVDRFDLSSRRLQQSMPSSNNPTQTSMD